jgi:hypothetical protein
VLAVDRNASAYGVERGTGGLYVGQRIFAVSADVVDLLVEIGHSVPVQVKEVGALYELAVGDSSYPRVIVQVGQPVFDDPCGGLLTVLAGGRHVQKRDAGQPARGRLL